MSEAKHTPPPWRIDDQTNEHEVIVILSDQPRADHKFHHVCNIDYMQGEFGTDDYQAATEISDEDRANARLIAAAPAMHLELQRVAIELARWLDTCRDLDPGFGSEMAARLVAVNATVAAVREAT